MTQPAPMPPRNASDARAMLTASSTLAPELEKKLCHFSRLNHCPRNVSAPATISAPMTIGQNSAGAISFDRPFERGTRRPRDDVRHRFEIIDRGGVNSSMLDSEGAAGLRTLIRKRGPHLHFADARMIRLIACCNGEALTSPTRVSRNLPFGAVSKTSLPSPAVLC